MPQFSPNTTSTTTTPYTSTKNKEFSRITEEDHHAVWNHLRNKHLDHYLLQANNSLDESSEDFLIMMHKVKDMMDMRRGSVPVVLPSHSSYFQDNYEEDDLVNISIDLKSSMEIPKYAQPSQSSLMQASQGNLLGSSMDCFCSASSLSSILISADDKEEASPPAVISPATTTQKNSKLNKDIEIRDDSIILYGNLKEKKVEDSFTIVVSPYEEIVIEKVTGKGKLYCFDYSSSSGKMKKLLDSEDENFEFSMSTSVEEILEMNRKSFLSNAASESKGIYVLESGRTYFFKYVKTRSKDSAILYYRNSYAL
ncbi:hypothetical protein FDP41_002676 [Naegleria fowleri]|uniref:Uncharacterized protein n=1 Tax=Naegleria fowleri TaxID=5763 RepID=A0A6A5BUS1_NAEFO|nr:uncharacterized protein FDP41_002676 [Naegleria fowleri]KAF0978161.1 hypothetical protein FDP41_002676 [Naegleria fowleri]CAG4712193.1 unnamed protein product [Naegleria fowleri]